MTGEKCTLYLYDGGWYTLSKLATMISPNAEGEEITAGSLYARIAKHGVGWPQLMEPKITKEERSIRAGKDTGHKLTKSQRSAFDQVRNLKKIQKGKYDNI